MRIPFPFSPHRPFSTECSQNFASEMLVGFDHVDDLYSASLNIFSAHPSEMKPVSAAAVKVDLQDLGYVTLSRGCV
jgi:hypothetical protein